MASEIRSVHHQLAAIVPGERTRALMEDAWQSVRPKVEKQVRGILKLYGPVTGHPELVAHVQEFLFRHWQELHTSKPEAFAGHPRDTIREELIRRICEVREEIFVQAHEHIEEEREGPMPGRDILLHQYRFYLNKHFRKAFGSVGDKETRQALKEKLLKEAIRRTDSATWVDRAIQQAAEDIGKSKPLEDIQTKPKAPKTARKAPIQPPAPVKKPLPPREPEPRNVEPRKPERRRTPTKAEEKPSPAKIPAPGKSEWPRMRGQYVGLAGAYQLVQTHLAHAEDTQQPHLMREARWANLPRLSGPYNAIRNHVVDGRKYGGYGSWNRMVTGKFTCSAQTMNELRDHDAE